jgi:hypothetical protein
VQAVRSVPRQVADEEKDRNHTRANHMTNKRAVLYVSVSTDHQSVENQTRDLRHVADRRGWEVVETYSDAGISGSKGRNQRPGLDALLKHANRGKFDIVLCWAIDRLGRSRSRRRWASWCFRSLYQGRRIRTGIKKARPSGRAIILGAG